MLTSSATRRTQIPKTNNKDYLTELDAAIGDADHGINMNRGFQKVITQLPTVESKNIGTILNTVSMTLLSSIGGASGLLTVLFSYVLLLPLQAKAKRN